MCKEHALFKFGADAQMFVYEDEGFSGGNVVRPQFQKLLIVQKAQRMLMEPEDATD
jgi:hypothetical protein